MGPPVTGMLAHPFEITDRRWRFGYGHGPWSHYTQGLVILKYPVLFPVSDIRCRCGCSGYARTRERPPDRSFCEPMLRVSIHNARIINREVDDTK